MTERRIPGVRLALAALVAAIAVAACSAGGRLTEPPAATLSLSVRFADAVLARWPDAGDLSDQGWEYNTGIVLHALSAVYRRTGDARYCDYIRRWADRYVDAEGHVDLGGTRNLDRIQPANLLLFLYEETGEERYRRAARGVRESLRDYPRNAEGGFWHKAHYPDEMWVDGIYMAGPFLVHYAALFGDDGACIDTALSQAALVARHAQDPRTGLLRHGWDQDANAAWADPATGLSPEVWCRGMGWYTMALVDMLAHLPAEDPAAEILRALLREVARGIRESQDPATGLWFQVMDKGDRPDNWTETSGSAMFVYALKTAVERGDLDAGYLDVAERGWEGLQSRIVYDAEGVPTIIGAVEGMGVQADYAGYVAKRRLGNSTHGLMAVLLAASAMENGAAD